MIPPIHSRVSSCALVLCLLPAMTAFRLTGAQDTTSCEPIRRQVPPAGIAVDDALQSQWRDALTKLTQRLQPLQSPLEADVAVLLKACRFALDFQELYSERDFSKVDRILQLAAKRLEELESDAASWPSAGGRQVRGFRSRVDDSVQPLGLLLPENWDRGPALPLFVWLHGRGDKTTDLHFLFERLEKDGQIAPPGCIVVHPFGRQCIGYKSAGETDVLEAIDFVCRHYPVDQGRIVLMGFSMGGAGVWHLAAHYTDRFVAASPGAGFAETARYRNLSPDQYPPQYEQMLWSIYDVPGYTRNLFGLPVVAYSGELDKQIQAARVMEQAFSAEGRTLEHLIGAGMEHKYHPDTLAEIVRRMQAAADLGQSSEERDLYLQTRHLRYATRRWFTIDGMAKPYADTRVDAKLNSAGEWELQTKNVSRLRIGPGAPANPIVIDGRRIVQTDSQPSTLLSCQSPTDKTWQAVDDFSIIRKRPGLSGPIDDAFIDPFLVVVPSGTSPHPMVDQWVRCELSNFLERWRTLFRGEARVRKDAEVSAEDLERFHIVAWGDSSSNRLLAKALASEIFPMQIRWDAQSLQLPDESFDSAYHVLLAIQPNPLNPQRYLVVNSGPTFRQAHDQTNSLQNPHLPDWVVVSTSEPPNAELPGKVIRTGFFDDRWRVTPETSWGKPSQ